MKLLLRVFAAMLVFAGIFAGCMTVLLLVVAMVRFPPLFVAVLLACWMFGPLRKSAR
ncbi:hypothetical protein [Pseudomonas songnenensis]|uniref:hypothetical protein n=1 Tax=Pseudomonas songnenensis TaxID=1176259 RepID=UPI0013ED545C|nr:hypothetical protein [Pseudomonas songnenensis]